MKLFEKYKLLIIMLLGWTGAVHAQEDCKDDINFSISNVTVNGAGQSYFSTEEQSLQVTIGQPYVGPSGSYNQGISSRAGFWSFYELEPQAPYTEASQGEYVDRIEVNWTVVGDFRGPVVTGEETKVYRNGALLTTVPVSQTSYVDYNVFPGEFYTYQIVTSNSLGDAWPMEAIGFLNPNGRITGKVETNTGAPVSDVKVILSPNLGRSLDLDGTNDYVYFVDQSYKFGDYYTIEGWWRNVETRDQTLFVAVDSGTTDVLVKISLDGEGKIRYYHDGDADGTGITLGSKDGYNLDAFDREWHHFAAVYDTSNVYLYVDGQRVAESYPEVSISEVAELEFAKDGPKQYANYYYGFLDEFRVWGVGRSREEIRRYKDITLTGEESYLTNYWKFDEQFGNTVYDYAVQPVEERENGFLCDVTRSDFISPAELGAYTDEGGDYLISGVYYGSGQTFSVIPSKETPVGYSLDFDGTDDFISYQLDRLVFDEAFTMEGWFKTGVDGQDMVIFEVTNSAVDETYMQLGIQSSGEFYASVGFGGSASTITSDRALNDEFWYHYAISHNGSEATVYIDGVALGTVADAGIADLTTRYVIGRSNPIDFEDGNHYFQGSLDEMRLWNYARTETQINSTINQIIPGDEQGIVDPDGALGVAAYWMLGEGQGSIISDATSNGHSGALMNYQETPVGTDDFIVANWNGDDIPLDVEYFEHDFDPNARNVSLDPSNTSVDRVDFTDISQIGISGFVRFSGSDCFASNIEMTVNGESLLPPVFTDEDGKFILELEPGTTGAFLSAQSSDYVFDPGFIELPRLVRPIAGLKFEVTNKRKITGLVAGGECLLPLGTADIRLLSSDGCYEVVAAIDETTGEFSIENLPPLEYQVSVVNHENTTIQSYFDIQGANVMDVSDQNDSIAFIYYSETQTRFEIEGTEANECGIQANGETAILLDQNAEYSGVIELFQVYEQDTCVLQSGVAYIEDDISPFAPRDTVDIVNGKGEYLITGGVPNLATPYTKPITVVGEDNNGAQSTAFEEVIVIGFKTLESTFETTSPLLPFVILRDPPGDASYSYLERESTVCNSIGFEYSEDLTITDKTIVHMGPDIEFSSGFGVEKTTEIDNTNDISFETSVSLGYGIAVEHEVCLTNSEILRTSDDELFLGEEGDVFVGGAYNVLVGTNRVLEVNSETCELQQEDVLMVLPSGFATTYIYSQSFIENSIIPDLEELGDTESVAQWQDILAYNDLLKEFSFFSENVSFTSGVELERASTNSQTTGVTLDLSASFAAELAVETGLQVDGVGYTMGSSIELEREVGLEYNRTENTTKTVGYNLNDEDFGDNYTVDIKYDAAGMPVFDLIAGESLCPWEPGTVTRTAVTTTALTPTNAVDIPEDEAAVFRFSLANVSETAEDQFYEFRVLQESNPDGAVVKVNGVLVEQSLSLFVRANQDEEVTITVEKGPEVYTYTDLEFEFYVPCELERAQILGLDVEDIIANDPVRSTFFSRQSVSVEFVQTCQEATVFSPGEDWLINNTSGDQITITISDIDLDQTELERFNFQYRQLVEGEPFVNGFTVEAPDVTGDSYSFDWDVTSVDDAPYELRITSECNSGFAPGISAFVEGRIDRKAPAVLGTPTPIDAVLAADDEITISFEEEIKCDELISLAVPVSLEQGSMNNVALANTETGLFIEATTSCEGNNLVIVPNIQNKFIEGQVLRVDVLGQQDLYGNIQTEQTTWEFIVDRDPLEWLGGDIQTVIYEGESPEIVRQVTNNGAFDVIVNLSGALDVQTLEETPVPSWIAAGPLSFTIPPGGTQEVTFSISDQIGGGEYDDVVTAATSFGAPELRFDVRVLCPEPTGWEVNPGDFENSMNIIAELDIRGELSSDEYDMVAAFVGDELRGVGQVVYTPELADIGENPYLLFLTVYTNSSVTEMLAFQVWDASRCQLYGLIEESYELSLSTGTLGSPTAPVSITVSNNLIQDVPLTEGWNWVSYNLNAEGSGTNEILSTLNQSVRGDIIKSQSDYSQYVPDVGWVGPLVELDNREAFRIYVSEADTIQVVGEPVDFETTFIELDSGWNWISYLPPVGMDINQALSSLNATSDFIIKNQTSFSQYVEFVGWVGSLDFMQPNVGYLILTNQAMTLEYPVNSDNARTHEQNLPSLPEGWEIDFSAYEQNANLVLSVEGFDVADEDLIGLFSDGTLMGYGQAKYIDYYGQFYFFLTAYGKSSDQIEIKYARGEQVWTDFEGELDFAEETISGSVDNPLIVSFTGEVLSTIQLLDEKVTLYPNPAKGAVSLEFTLNSREEVAVKVHDLSGKQLMETGKLSYNAGRHVLQLDRGAEEDRFPTGLYVIDIEIGSTTITRKLIWE